MVGMAVVWVRLVSGNWLDFCRSADRRFLSVRYAKYYTLPAIFRACTHPYELRALVPETLIMDCSEKERLLEVYAAKVDQYYAAADRLALMVGNHEEFENARKLASLAARAATNAQNELARHQAEHGC